MDSIDLETDDINNNGTKQSENDTSPLIATQDTQNTLKSQWNKKHSIIAFVVFIIIVIVIIVIVVVVDNESSESGSNNKKADILYVFHEQGRIYTMDPIDNEDNNGTVYSVHSFCVDTRSGEILKVGYDGENIVNDCRAFKHNTFQTLSFTGDRAQNITILPGLTDSHAHIMSLGSNFFRADLSQAQSIDDIITSIQSFMDENGFNDTQWVTGWGWDQNSWNDFNGTYPDRFMLDDAFPNTKLFLRRIDGHAGWINTAALNAVPPFPQDDPEGGEIIRDDGVITGVLIDRAMDLVSPSIPAFTLQEQYTMLQMVLEECARNGLTGVHDAGDSPSQIEMFESVIDDPEQFGFEFTMRVNAMASRWYLPSDYRKRYLYKDLLTVETVKFMLDGALGSYGALLVEPYCDRENTTGVNMYDDVEQYYQNISAWNSDGWQLATHAIGDGANREVINQYIRLINETGMGLDHRMRIEHAQIVNASVDIPRIGKYKIIPSMQPTHATSDMVFAESRLCEYRLTGAYAWVAMLNASVPAMPFGSDFPAVGVVNPFLGIYAAITRQNETGYPEGGWTEYNKVSRYQAVKGYTYDAAYSAFQEDDLGTISEGKYADFIVIDRDIFEIDEMDILDTNVVATFLGGSSVYIDPEYVDWFS